MISEPPTIDVAIVTWPVSPARLAYAQVVFESLFGHLVAKRHKMRFIVSIGQEQDPERRWCGPELVAYLDRIGIAWEWRTRFDRERLGYAMNEAVGNCTAPYVLLVQDDSVLTDHLNLSDAVDLMEADGKLDLVRLGWSLRSSFAMETEPYKPGWLRVKMDSVMPYSDNPHLRRQTFHQKFGAYSESRTHGESEKFMLDQVRYQRAEIVIPDRAPLFFSFGAEPCDWREPNRRKVLERLGGPR